MRSYHAQDKVDLIAELQPETPLERLLLEQPQVQEGLMWGLPRYGHPEGEVYKHVKEVLSNIERLSPLINKEERERLRLVAFVHDTFKFLEDKTEPRNWHKHHAVLARRFMEGFTEDVVLLNIIQYHDEIYYIWRDTAVYNEQERAIQRMLHLLNRLLGHNQLYYYFFKCDTAMGIKTPPLSAGWKPIYYRE
ncbi:MAG: HD domain-containing protein [Saprospiraceae bacterium]